VLLGEEKKRFLLGMCVFGADFSPFSVLCVPLFLLWFAAIFLFFFLFPPHDLFGFNSPKQGDGAIETITGAQRSVGQGDEYFFFFFACVSLTFPSFPYFYLFFFSLRLCLYCVCVVLVCLCPVCNGLLRSLSTCANCYFLPSFTP
jgi:hypothetical protein